MKNSEISIISAVSENRIIGNKGEIPWHLPEDLKRFAQITTGHTVVMGRKTFESIGKPLRHRTNIVVSKNHLFKSAGVLVLHSWEEVIDWVRLNNKKVFVIGGEGLYTKALPYAKTIYLTLVKRYYKGDARFPVYDPEAWISEVVGQGNEKGLEYSFLIFKKKSVVGEFVELKHSRTEAQEKVMAEILTERVCPFCPEHLLRFHEDPIVLDGAHWIITPNHTPYENTSVHLLAIPKRHVLLFGELRREELEELQKLTETMRTEKGLPGLSLLMRYGKLSFTGASVNHLHCHLVAGTGNPEKKVRARIG